jgi:hypothetical protein
MKRHKGDTAQQSVLLRNNSLRIFKQFSTSEQKFRFRAFSTSRTQAANAKTRIPQTRRSRLSASGPQRIGASTPIFVCGSGRADTVCRHATSIPSPRGSRLVTSIHPFPLGKFSRNTLQAFGSILQRANFHHPRGHVMARA